MFGLATVHHIDKQNDVVIFIVDILWKAQENPVENLRWSKSNNLTGAIGIVVHAEIKKKHETHIG